MILRTLMTAVIALTLTATAPADALKFANTASKIEFVGTKKDGSHNGGFKKFTGTIDAPGGDISKGKVTVEIQTESITTDNEKLSGHLKSPDFFDVRTFPKATFTSTQIRATPGDAGYTHLITGDLTLHGVTKSVRIPVRTEATATGMSLTGKFTLQRKEFGMVYGEGMVNNDVAVTLTIQAGK